MNIHNFLYDGTKLFAFGSNRFGQLGLGDCKHRTRPTILNRDKTIQQIVCGSHSFILKKSGELFVFGNNQFGQLGLGDYYNRATPILLMQDQNIRQIVCGINYSLILKKSGELFAFGGNEHGQLGLGDNKNRNVPTLVMHDENIDQIICGGWYTFILKKSSEIFVFGGNENGQLGLEDNENRNIPILLMKDKRIQQIVCGIEHTFILTKSGKLFAFGCNQFGQLGLGDYYNRATPTLVMQDKGIKEIICGGYHSFIIKKSNKNLENSHLSSSLPHRQEQNEIFAFGYNEFGQLCLGHNENINTPTLLIENELYLQIICGLKCTFILMKSGKLFDFRHDKKGQAYRAKKKQEPILLGTFENIVSINETLIEKIKWNPNIYSILSKTKKKEIQNFLLVCHYYKLIHKINMVKYMRHAIISSLF